MEPPGDSAEPGTRVEDRPAPAGDPAPTLRRSQRTPLIALIDPDPVLGQDLAIQIGYFGYRVQSFLSLADARAAPAGRAPSAVIMDLALLPPGGEAGVALGAPGGALDGVPVVLTAARDDLPARLRGLRAGGCAFFPKPIEVGSLINTLDMLTAVEPPEPYRILIVDDEPMLARHAAHALDHAGMQTRTVTDPLQVLAALADFQPDLILTDLYMPGCSGIELAAVIRQQEAYVSLPIIFLSSESDMQKQIAALRGGADDFLTKPIQALHLVTAVTTRAARMRTLRALMARDSLTGLLNHAVIKERLEGEVARARRDSTPLAFAILDLDRFKLVNDTYGHTTGDRVLKSLAHLLQQRLRQTDILGRLGGEEFAVILPNTTGQAAFAVLDALRSSFAQTPQGAAGAEFFVTFSGGIATLRPYGDAPQLNEGADKALYQAKLGGRNRMVQAAEDS